MVFTQCLGFTLLLCVCVCRTEQDDKSDVYDIGIILIEIIVGRPITSENVVVLVKDLVSACDSTI